LSNNGLLLQEKAESLLAAGVKTITVTVNAVDAGILAQICSHIVYNGQYITSESAAREAAEQYIPVFRHCKQCRADACGIPGKGKDVSRELYEYDEPIASSHG